MLEYAAKLTLQPAEITRDDMHTLWTVGFSDEDILAIVEVASYYAYANRIVDGLGVSVE